MKSKFKTSNSRHDEEPAEALHHLVGAEEHDGLRKLGREAGPVVAENELEIGEEPLDKRHFGQFFAIMNNQ